ncbi:hypothetical protein Bcep1808_1926 [Burkholderia vietnamiensis G4]|uniref:Uncharacterized protein n=1 Tax=Burkholderia vietnamiensis (strain G4 / LMG 22486) TaxID=269482 RepID=A4JF76_BURVG|nr:hypothetical protein Bcep1808_1926 [Burkholderia vietnamiensis G4]
MTDYRTLWLRSQPLPIGRVRVFADCSAGRRTASESGARLERRQIGMLYSLAKSTSKCRTLPAFWGGIEMKDLRHAHSHVPNRKPAQPGCRPRGMAVLRGARAAVRQPA